MVEVREDDNLLLVFDYDFLNDLLQDYEFTGVDNGMLSGLAVWVFSVKKIWMDRYLSKLHKEVAHGHSLLYFLLFFDQSVELDCYSELLL